MLRSGFSLLMCLLLGNIAFAQRSQPTQTSNEPTQLPATEDTVVRARLKRPDSLKVKFYPRSIRFGTDVLTLIKSGTQSTFTGWEANADVDFGKLYLAFDYGSWGRNLVVKDSANGNYHNSGTYWRLGADINLLKKDPDRNMFFFGFRYARASYSDVSNLTFTDAVFGSYQQTFSNTSVSASWFELTTGLRVKIWKDFWMGYTARMKFAPKTKGDTEITSYDIPGYGLHAKSIYWGFNYQIFYRIPFGKEKKKVQLIK